MYWNQPLSMVVLLLGSPLRCALPLHSMAVVVPPPPFRLLTVQTVSLGVCVWTENQGEVYEPFLCTTVMSSQKSAASHKTAQCRTQSHSVAARAMIQS